MPTIATGPALAPAAAPSPRPSAGFAAALEAQGAAPGAERGVVPPGTPPAAPCPRSPPAAALRAVEAAQARLDAVLAAARSGRTFTAAELLGLQAEAYRLSQTLDLAGKLVEQGVQGVKQAVQTQV